MLTVLLLSGVIVFGLAFAMWLATFLLNRGLNTTLETEYEAHKSVWEQLGWGAVLLGITLAFGIAVFQTSGDSVLPDVPPGLEKMGSPSAAPVPDDNGMGATLVGGGIFLFGAAFLLWLVIFFVNRSVSSSLKTAREDRRSEAAQITLGVVLFLVTACLITTFSQMDRSALVPDVAIATPAERVQAIVPQNELVKKLDVESEEDLSEVVIEVTE